MKRNLFILLSIIIIAALALIAVQNISEKRKIETEEGKVLDREKINNAEILTLEKHNSTYEKIEYKWQGEKFRAIFFEDLRNSLDWIENNIPKNATITSLWDYGHSIRGYTGENVVIYNPSRISLSSLEGWDVEKRGPFSTHETFVDVNTIIAALDPENAVALMRKHNSKYLLLTTSDIGKYPTIAAWSRHNNCRAPSHSCYQRFFKFYKKGNKITYTDNLSIRIENDTLTPRVKTGGKKTFFEKVIVERENGEFIIQDFSKKENVINGTLWISFKTFPELFYVVYIPPYLENSLFTQLFFEDAKGLESFILLYKDKSAKVYKLSSDGNKTGG